MTSSHLYPLGCHFSTIEKIDYYFRFFKYQLSVVTYLVNQVASMKNLVTMTPKVIEVWRVENSYSLETTSIHTKQSDSVAKHWIFLKSLVLNQYQHLTTVVVGAKGTKTYTTTLERVGVRTEMPHSHLAAS